MMINIHDIIEMIKLGEGWKIEFKAALPKPSSFASTLVAFANHQGGTILIGVDDRGKVIGFKATKEDTDSILRAGRDACKPSMPGLSLNEFILENKPVLAVSVPEGSSEVYASSDGKYLAREGSENVAMEWRKLHRLITERKKITFEQLACEGSAYEDLDMEKVRRHIKARAEKFRVQLDMPMEDILKSRKCVLDQAGRLVPTNAGMLLFGKEPQRFLPMSCVTVVKFKGKDQAQGYEDRKDFQGTLVELIDRTIAWIDDRMYHGGKVPERGAVRREVMQFHLPSLREIVVNAVAHRDYANTGSRIIVRMFDDRLEVQSPGKLPAHVTPKNILREQYARNPFTLQTLTEWGFGEAIGQGMDLVFGDLKRERYPKPKLLDTGASFVFTMMAKDVKKALGIRAAAPRLRLNERQERALAYLRKHEALGLSDYLKLNPHVTPRTASRDLAALVEQGKLIARGRKKGQHYVISDKADVR